MQVCLYSDQAMLRYNHLKLVQSMVAKLRSSKEESGLQHTDGSAGRDCVKVLDYHLMHLKSFVSERDSVNVAVFTLQCSTHCSAALSRQVPNLFTLEVDDLASYTYQGRLRSIRTQTFLSVWKTHKT